MNVQPTCNWSGVSNVPSLPRLPWKMYLSHLPMCTQDTAPSWHLQGLFSLVFLVSSAFPSLGNSSKPDWLKHSSSSILKPTFDPNNPSSASFLHFKRFQSLVCTCYLYLFTFPSLPQPLKSTTCPLTSVCLTEVTNNFLVHKLSGQSELHLPWPFCSAGSLPLLELFPLVVSMASNSSNCSPASLTQSSPPPLLFLHLLSPSPPNPFPSLCPSGSSSPPWLQLQAGTYQWSWNPARLLRCVSHSCDRISAKALHLDLLLASQTQNRQNRKHILTYGLQTSILGDSYIQWNSLESWSSSMTSPSLIRPEVLLILPLFGSLTGEHLNP